MIVLRPAQAADMAACASIVNDWIDATDWMPRCHPADDVVRHYREDVFSHRAVTVADQDGAIAGFLALEDQTVTALYVAAPLRDGGIGSALLRRAHEDRETLDLWVLQPNEGARRLYVRHGFQEVRRTEGDNEERLPDIQMAWRRGTA